MISVIIAGAGHGQRINKHPKAFIKIGGKELIYHSLNRFYKITKNITVVLPEEYVIEWQKKFKEAYKGIRVVKGGTIRQDSVKKGLDSLKNTEGIILVHDVARPFFTEKLVEKVVEGAKQYGACIPYLPVQDTIKEFEGVFVKNTLMREKIVLVQTPQAFKSSILRNAYRKAYEDNFYGSDDAVLVERTGLKVYMTYGDRENIKITYPVDIEIAKVLFRKWVKAKQVKG
jgi:2-C-methyl-D-erythritol 4-phosphate cytidylyltransferase